MIKTTSSQTGKKKITKREAGNAIVMLFAAIGVAGMLTYGLNNIIRGPAVTAAEVSRRTIAENNLVASTRLALSAATRSQSNNGDCDGDGFVEPVPYRDAGVLPKPTGGGLLPITIGGSLSDPWNNQYGYCVWDAGTASVSDNIAGCGGLAALRLEGSPRDDQPILAVISAGKDGTFQTSCNAYVDTTPADGIPDTAMINKPAGTDDVVLSYTYTEANGIGAGEWKLKPADSTTAEISKNLDVQGGASFTGPLRLQNKGLVLPGDPGDDSVTGICDAGKDQQIRRNTSTSPPTLEICDFANGSGWTTVSGGGTTPAVTGFDPAAHNCTSNGSGPLVNAASNNPGGNGAMVWGDGTYIYTAHGSSGISAYSYNGTTLTLLDSDNVGGSNIYAVYGDGTYIYTVDDNNLRAYTFNGTTLTSIATYALAAPAYDIYTSGGYIYVANTSGGVLALAFNGTAFTLLNSYVTPAANSVYSDGTYIYVGDSTNGLYALTFNGTAFALAGTYATTAPVYDVWTDGNYVYAAQTTDGVVAYYFNGTNFILAASYDSGVDAKNLWGDGVNIFVTTATGIEVYSFNGTFSFIESLSTGGITWSPWGDGSYIYAVRETGGLYVFSGYACLSVAAVATPADTQNTIGDPLDDGLVAHWKMDEGTGTTVADSVGTYTGTFINTPQWMKNTPHGSSGLHFTIANRDAVQINGLMGTPSTGTISMWVNFEDENGASEIANVFDIGNYVVLQTQRGLGPVLETYDGSTRTRTTPSIELKGLGWHHIAATFDDPNNTFRVYLDGVLMAESVYANPIVYTGLGTNTFIARHGNAGTINDLDGAIDDVRFYSRALSPSEMQKLYKRSRIESKVAESASYTPSGGIPMGKISKGSTITCGIKMDGSLWCWGSDNIGALGNGATVTANQVTPYKVSDSSAYETISTSSRATCGIRKDGVAFCWGWNLYGQNGRGPTGGGTDTDAPGAQVINAGSPWVQVVVSKGSEYVLGIKADGTGWSWGGDFNGMLGNGGGSTAHLGTPAAISGGGKWVMFSADSNVACGIKTDRKAYCWGLDGVGQLGNGAGVTGSKDAPTLVDDPGPWSYISAEDGHACGIKMDGTLWCWGNDTDGKLGNGPLITADQISPSLISREKWIKVETAANTTCGLRADATIWCWGLQNQGQLGNNGSTSSDIPASVTAQQGWIDMVNSQYGGCAIARDQSMWCWGRDLEGQLGNGSGITGSQNTPSRVENWLNPWAWDWSDNATHLLLNTGYNLALGTAKLQPSATTNNIYFGFTAAGQAKSYSVGTTSHVTLETSASNTSSQLSFKTAPNNTPADNTTNLVGYWPMDDATGSTTAAATFGTAGTVFNRATFTATRGKNLGSVLFDESSSQYIRVTNAAYLRPATITISFWMRPSAVQQIDATIFNKAHTNNTGVIARSYSAFLRSGHLIWRTGGGGSNDDLVSNNVFKSDEWVYITLVMEPTGSAPNKRIYINGVLDNSKHVPIIISYDSTASGNFFIGQAGCASACSFFNGEIDDFRIYSSAFGATETLNLYNYLTSFYQKPRSVGIDYSNNNLEFGRNVTAVTNWMDAITPDMTITSTGDVGVGTGTPQAALDINGGIKIGGDFECSAAGQAGKIRYVAGNATKWQYCDGSSWVAFGSLLPSLWKIDNKPGSISKSNTNGCAIANDGNAYCWGYATDGALGNGTTTPNVTVSTKVQTDTGPGSWTDWKSISTGGSFTCGIRTNGTAWCWGKNSTGQLGTGGGNTTRPTQVRDSAGTGYWSDWVQIDATGLNTCGIRVDGTLWCWGFNDQGQIGDNTTSQRNLPTQVKDSAGTGYWSDWLMVDTKSSTTCGLRTNGTLWCWGDATKGNLGNGTTTPSVSLPVQVKDSAGTGNWSDWITITNGYDYNACGLRADGTAWCWGNAGYGSLGNNSTSPDRSLPVQVLTDTGAAGWTNWVAISNGLEQTCGILSDGTAWCWGRGSNGQLGYGSTSNTVLPVKVQTDTGPGAWSDWVSISASSYGTCGSRSNGTIWCWGTSANGQLGNGTSTPDVSRPVQVQ